MLPLVIILIHYFRACLTTLINSLPKVNKTLAISYRIEKCKYYLEICKLVSGSNKMKDDLCEMG